MTINDPSASGAVTAVDLRRAGALCVHSLTRDAFATRATIAEAAADNRLTETMKALLALVFEGMGAEIRNNPNNAEILRRHIAKWSNQEENQG